MSRDVFAARPGLRRGVFRASFALAKALPPWLARTLAFLIAHVAWFCDARGRRVVARNLAHFVPPGSDALRRAVRRSYVDFCLATYESFAMPRLPATAFRAPNLRLVDPWGAYARMPLPGPTVVLTIHSHWELVLAVAHHFGLNQGMEAIALSYGDPAIDALFARMRESVNCKTLLLDRGGPLASLRALKDGKTLGVVGERDYTGSGLRLRFAGEDVSMPVGAAAMAVQTGAVVIPHLLARRGWTRWTMVIGRPLRADPAAPKQRQVAELTAELADTFARFIAAAPAQWVAFHDHWPHVGAGAR